MKSSKVVIISSGQPSLNPRLVKEADTLARSGFEVIVFYAYWNEWGTAMDEELLRTRKWTAVKVGGDPVTSRFIYLVSKIIHRLSKFAFMAGFDCFAELAIARSSYFLIVAARNQSADLYIAHNLGALPAAAIAAKKFDKPKGFDAEDFHRYELSNDDNDPEVRLKTLIENKYIPHADYFTASSRPIAKAYQSIFKHIRPVVLHNVFPSGNVTHSVVEVHGPLKLVWVSQTIGHGRGLDDIFGAIGFLKNTAAELHLVGHLPNEQQAYIDQLIKTYPVNLTIHPPVHPDRLVEFVSRFDIGLALEPAFSKNNDYALSNKLFIYLQAGLAVIASDTVAQMDFMNRYEAIGRSYPKGNSTALATILDYYAANSLQLLQAKAAAFALAKATMNWDLESRKFVDMIKGILN